MFDERTVKAYRSITAPPELKARVLARAESEKAVQLKNRKKMPRTLRQLSAAAACLVLIVGVWAASRESGRGLGITADAVVLEASADQELLRAAAEEPVTVKVEISRKAELSCGEGELLVQEKGDAAPVNQGQSCRVGKNTTVLWQIPAADAEESYALTLSCGSETRTLTLLYDTAENCWAVSFAEE